MYKFSITFSCILTNDFFSEGLAFQGNVWYTGSVISGLRRVFASVPMPMPDPAKSAAILTEASQMPTRYEVEESLILPILVIRYKILSGRTKGKKGMASTPHRQRISVFLV